MHGVPAQILILSFFLSPTCRCIQFVRCMIDDLDIPNLLTELLDPSWPLDVEDILGSPTFSSAESQLFDGTKEKVRTFHKC